MTASGHAYSLDLPAAVIERLFEHARSDPVNEVCGLLAITADGGVRVYPMSNVAAHPDRAFLMEPRAQLEAFVAMREADETLFGIYHSHPQSAALPSAEDLSKAAYPGVVYFIISLRDAELRAYHFDGETFVPVTLAGGNDAAGDRPG